MNQNQTIVPITGNLISDLSNAVAVIWGEFAQKLPLNWAGFYLDNGRELILGPFQGKMACTHIAYHRGVCGKAYTSQDVIIVPDVHQFSDHIACDPQSRSEMVIPLLAQNTLIGVFDLDSPKPNTFQLSTQHDVSNILTPLLTHYPAEAYFRLAKVVR